MKFLRQMGLLLWLLAPGFALAQPAAEAPLVVQPLSENLRVTFKGTFIDGRPFEISGLTGGLLFMDTNPYLIEYQGIQHLAFLQMRATVRATANGYLLVYQATGAHPHQMMPGVGQPPGPITIKPYGVSGAVLLKLNQPMTLAQWGVQNLTVTLSKP